jgi:hypothetical protein
MQHHSNERSASDSPLDKPAHDNSNLSDLTNSEHDGAVIKDTVHPKTQVFMSLDFIESKQQFPTYSSLRDASILDMTKKLKKYKYSYAYERQKSMGLIETIAEKNIIIEYLQDIIRSRSTGKLTSDSELADSPISFQPPLTGKSQSTLPSSMVEPPKHRRPIPIVPSAAKKAQEGDMNDSYEYAKILKLNKAKVSDRQRLASLVDLRAETPDAIESAIKSEIDDDHACQIDVIIPNGMDQQPSPSDKKIADPIKTTTPEVISQRLYSPMPSNYSGMPKSFPHPTGVATRPYGKDPVTKTERNKFLEKIENLTEQVSALQGLLNVSSYPPNLWIDCSSS